MVDVSSMNQYYCTTGMSFSKSDEPVCLVGEEVWQVEFSFVSKMYLV